MMKKRIFCAALTVLFCVSLFSACGEATDEVGVETQGSETVTEDVRTTSSEQNTEERVMQQHKLVALTDQKNDEIVVIDMDAEDITSDSAVVWSWRADKLGDVDYANRSRSRLDDVKLRYCEAWGGFVVGVTSSGGLIALVSYPSGRCLFNADAAGYGPHSIEILPDGSVVVACSGNANAENGQIRIYPALSKTGAAYVADSLESAHGVCWDPENEVLWALGASEIRAYDVGGTREKPTLTVLQGMGMQLGASGGHDLSPVYGNTDRLWITYSKGVVQYSKEENKLYSGYAGYDTISTGSVKSVNSFLDGTVVWTVADKNNGTATHDTNVLNVFTYEKGSSGKWLVRKNNFTFPSRDFYKARAFVSDYQ